MAPVESDPEGWSSNWKILQAKLKAEQATKPTKRNASSQDEQVRKLGEVKRQKIQKIQNSRRRAVGKGGERMGSTFSQYNPLGKGGTTVPSSLGNTPDKVPLNQVNDKQPDPSNRTTRTRVASTSTSQSSLARLSTEHAIPQSSLIAAYGPNNLSSASLSAYTLHHPTTDIPNAGISPSADSLAGKYIGLDCEMVGVGPNPNQDSALARISLVNFHGIQLYDSYVLPKETVTDYRTHVSGITRELLRSARTLEIVQSEVAPLLNGRILVGHALRNDLDALLLGHPRRDIRDTSKYLGYRTLMRTKYPGLKRLAKEVLGVDIQSGEHSSVEDARVAMWLYRTEKEGFEREHAKQWGVERVRGPQKEGESEDGVPVGGENRVRNRRGKKKRKK